MSKWENFWEIEVPVFLQLLVGHKKQMKSVPCKECKGWSNAKMLLHRKNKTRDKTTTELLSSQNVQGTEK